MSKNVECIMAILRTLLFILLISASSVLAQQTVSLYDIQYTDDPSGDSPYAGSRVITGGIVTAVDYGGVTKYFIGDGAGGPWRGLHIRDVADRGIAIGDSVRFEGEVYESGNETRMRNITSTGYVRVANVREIPASATTTGTLGGENGEPFEGVLVELSSVTVTAVGATWTIDDGSGPCQVGSGFDYTYIPTQGDSLRAVRGVVVFSGGSYKLEPRGGFDFDFWSNQPPLISNVQQTPENPTAEQAVIVTARISDETDVADAQLFYKTSNDEQWQNMPMLDDGMHGDGYADDGVYGALLPVFPAFAEVQYYIRATDNDDASSTNPLGAPEDYYNYIVRSTTLSVFDIQYTPGPGDASPLDGELVTLEEVVVTAVGFDGNNFFVSDPTPGPWRGVYVYGNGSSLDLGDRVRFTSRVTEYYGLTELGTISDLTVLSSGEELPPLLICATTFGDSGEMYEGCFVEVGEGVVTSGPDLYNQFTYRDACGTFVVDHDFAYDYEAVAGDSAHFMRGMVTYHDATGHKLDPRGDFDIGVIDKRAPNLLQATAISYLQFNLQFNEALDSASAVNPENYTLSDFTAPEVELPLRSARLFSNKKIVALEPWDSLKTGYTYTISVLGIRDISNNAIDTAQSVDFTGYSERAYAPMDSLYDFFEIYRDSTLTVAGVVTFVQDVTTTGGSRRISAYMQDASGRGLNLSETGPAGDFPFIQRGNLIEITGLITEYSGGLQMGGFTAEGAIKLLSEDMPLPEPIEFATGDRYIQQSIIRTSVSGVMGSGTWCQVTGTIYRVDENVGGGTNIMIDDGSGNTTIRVWDDMGLTHVTLDGVTYATRDLVGVTCKMAGPSSFYNTDFQMLGGYAEDITPAQPVGVPSAKAMLEVEARPFAPDMGQTIKISYNAPMGAFVKLRIFNLRGQVVTTLINKTAVGPYTISWDGRNELRELVPLGTYIVHLESENLGKKTSEMKPVVVGTRLK